MARHAPSAQHSLIIGLTVVAFGSNMLNLLAVLGASAVVAPASLSVPPSINAFDAPVMPAVAFAR